jgi:hypothetical protein
MLCVPFRAYTLNNWTAGADITYPSSHAKNQVFMATTPYRRGRLCSCNVVVCYVGTLKHVLKEGTFDTYERSLSIVYSCSLLIHSVQASFDFSPFGRNIDWQWIIACQFNACLLLREEFVVVRFIRYILRDFSPGILVVQKVDTCNKFPFVSVLTLPESAKK